MRYLLTLALLLFAPLAHGQAGFAFTNLPGPHGVGLHIVHQYDFSRSYRAATDAVTGQASDGRKGATDPDADTFSGRGRAARTFAIRIICASRRPRKCSGKTMPKSRRPPKASATVSSALPEARVQAEIERAMWAVRDAAPEAGKFPVVIYAPSFGAPAP